MNLTPYRPRERRHLRRLARRSWREAQKDPFSFTAGVALEALSDASEPIELLILRLTA